MIHDITTLLSLALTPATIIAALAVVYFYLPTAKNAFYENHKTEMHWLVLGVLIGFLGSAVDNFYWGLAWSADYLGHPARAALFENGVYANLPFRQVTTLLAAGCHVRAAVTTDSLKFRWIVASSWVSAIALVLGLYLARELM